MNFMTIWNFLNGKKVTIGALIMLLAQVLRMTGRGEWAEIVEQLAGILNNAGLGIVGVGLAHKAVKKTSN